jgi:serine/threonine-protein kinase
MAQQQIDRYVLKGVLGEGAMGRVYLAYDPKFNREVALKVIREAMLDDERVRKWFHREARAMAQLQHPGIVEVHDYSGNDAKMPYLVMERLHGHTLKDVILKRGVCSGVVLCELAIQLGQALQHAHSTGLVHRDLKPDNLFVEPNGRIVVTDFGLARAQLNVDLGASLASAGTAVVGTPLFLAPEAIHDPKQAGPKSDLYAVGVILYFAASLKLPFLADDPFQAISRILAGQHPPVSTHRRDLEAPVAEAIERTFALDPQTRPQDGAALEALFAKVRDAIAPGTDSLAALVTFMNQTDEFNSFTQATHMGAPEVSFNTPPIEEEMATNPNPVTVTVSASLQTPVEATVVSKADHTQVVTVARTQMVTAKAEADGEGDASGTPQWMLITAAAALAIALIAAVFVWRQRSQPALRAPDAATVAKADPLPLPPPSERVDVPPDPPPPPQENAPHVVPKDPSPRPEQKRPRIGDKPAEKVEPGTLRVNTGPIWADIFVNGDKRGQTPFKAAIELPPGKYKVRLVNPDYGTQEHTVVINAGEPTQLKVTLGKK